MATRKPTKRCERCAHWLEGTCDMARTDDGKSEKTTLAKAQDYEGYHAYLETDANFGCVQWQPLAPIKEG